MTRKTAWQNGAVAGKMEMERRRELATKRRRKVVVFQFFQQGTAFGPFD
ncbi:hypothetical protein L195_g027473 [Trifolium pratense]|uniref:Uncharacterized protein n=1 Tax=Trifolium pratense TaxID=57577 RepID=A0A2K3KZ83_TRIPR|nr:hypothetical protein L195_g027473 [Trifolium pratense]